MWQGQQQKKGSTDQTLIKLSAKWQYSQATAKHPLTASVSVSTIYGTDRKEEQSEQQVVSDGRQNTGCQQIKELQLLKTRVCCFLTAGQVTVVGPDGRAVVLTGATEGRIVVKPGAALFSMCLFDLKPEEK